MRAVYFFLILLTACGKKEDSKNAINEGVKKVDYKVGIVLGLGGLGDKSFSDSAYEGLLKAEKELGIKIKYVEPTTLSEFDQFLTEFAEANYDLIIGLSFDAEKGIEKVAKEYPGSNFVIIDSVVDLPNVKSIIFNQKEGSFLAGAVGQMVSKNNSLGFIGAIQAPLIKNFYEGYEQGAHYMNPNVKVKDIYIGGSNPFNDPARAKELAISMAENGVDVIFTVAGGSGRGVMEAIKGRENLYGIGVDSNQDGEVKGKILTSILKRVDVSVFNAVSEGLAGNFTAGTIVLGLKENGMGTTDFEFSKELIGEENLAKLEQIKKDLISGKIEIK
ncbi:MAG: BMP family ABC transporter substrate-binding protein [Fusobacteriia bacterium 4572_74]|nr:MAG: BMP family ABC transporter substrate-binding protein [Fusobacteriia bacterium 4572_74]